MNVGAGLLLLGAGQGLFLATLLLIRPSMRIPANLFLAALIGGLALTLLDDFALGAGFYAGMPGLIGWPLIAMPFLAPALRLHIDAVTERGEWHWQDHHRRLLIVPAVCLALLVPFLALPPPTRAAILADTSDASVGVITALYTYLAAFVIVAVQQGHALYRSLNRVSRFAEGLDPSTLARLIWLRAIVLLASACWLGYVAS
ncbi:MAG: hypothetical protein RL367_2229, partial [Pseudomonadota bacterium]